VACSGGLSGNHSSSARRMLPVLLYLREGRSATHGALLKRKGKAIWRILYLEREKLSHIGEQAILTAFSWRAERKK